MTFPATGLVPILATPFEPDGTLDRPGLRRLTEFQLDCGVAGLAVFGLASEGFSLTAAEKAAILADVRTVAGPEVAVIAGVNATSTATAVEQAQAAADAGADALMVLPPFLTKQPAGRLGDFFATVAERSGLPVMVQDAPAATGVAMSVPLLVELSKLAGVEAVKIETQPTAPKIGAVVDAGTAWAVFGGQNALFVLEEYARGGVGTMPACEFADALAVVLRDWDQGRVEDAHRGFNALLPLIRFGLQPGIAHAVHKDVLVRRGVIDHDTVRDPVQPLDPGSLAALDLIWRMNPLPAWTPSR
ncbi:dihydrodipicolinate synthase family protein [Microlunatus parietis]|uniref:4-hydroxy-tetrahydrodipicolinate synthase n=1 Tax=Microlunatus parietis TaxID=682979 RepID=A0A7Y9I4N4_9ACTN|nr:dihydrodipicolinate synthase family protein [Microlunatus parietis]NYE70211.1 4-hydroxy-tetrahydrodipicolinate synthase [Microlunatus parietis]